MKRLAYISLAISAMMAFAACADEATYEPGPQVAGPQYYFSSSQATSVNINHTTQAVSIDVYRIETTSAATTTISVTDASGLISNANTATASFAAGSNKATISFPVVPSDWTFAKNYPVTYKITSDTTPYGSDEVTVTYKYPTPLKNLGKATINESYMHGKEFSATIYQSEIDPNEFHITKFTGSKSDDFIFYVTKAGDSFGSVSYNTAGLIHYGDTKIGLTYADVGGDSADDIYILHPSRFTSLPTEDYWANNKVAIYQDNGLPAVVEIAPFYYMFGLGGWNKSTAATITIVFPGYDPKDYTVTASYAGIFTDTEDQVYGEATVALGEDIESAIAVLVEGDSEEAIAAAVETLKAGEDESIVPVTGQTVRIALPEEPKTGKYTIVVAGVAAGEVQETSATSFFYQAGSVAIDWDWLVGTWNAQDTEGDPYQMAVTKVDETTANFIGIWGMGADAVLTGTVDFEAKTVTFKGPVYLGEIAGGKLYIAHYNAETESYDDGEFYATLSPSGITISGHGYYIEGGQYEGDQGTDTTKMTK